MINISDNGLATLYTPAIRRKNGKCKKAIVRITVVATTVDTDRPTDIS